MKFYTTLLLLAAPLMGMQAQEVYLSSDFEGANPREGYTWSNEDGMSVKAQDVARIFDTGGATGEDGVSSKPVADWFLADGVNGNYSRVMMSYSRRTYEDVATDNWLFTPQLDIKSDNAWLAWDAQSIHYHLRESYEVYVCTDKDDFDSMKLVYSTNAENYWWTHHLVSLKEFVGKKVYVAFVHTSTNKYLFAIDNVFVGELPVGKFENTDRTLHATGTSRPTGVDGTLRNIGADAANYTLRCTTVTPQLKGADGVVPADVTAVQTLPVASLKSNETFDYHFDVAVNLNKTTRYTVELLNDKGNVVDTLVNNDFIFASNYPRTLLMEKATAFWCTACPEQNPFAYALEHRYGEQMAEVVAQWRSLNGSDPGQMTNSDYLENIKTYNLPTLFFNRAYESQNGSQREEMSQNAFMRPCYAMPTIASASCDGQTVRAKVKCEFAGNLSNVNNRFVVGVTLTENIVDVPLPQESLVSTRNCNEYFYLPSKFASPLNYYVNVVREGSTAFAGIKDALPAQIEAGKVYEADYAVPLPAKVRDLKNPLAPEESNLTLVAFVLNTSTKEVVNACKLPVEITGTVGIDQTVAERQPELVECEGSYVAVFPEGETGTVSVFTTDGRLVQQGNDLRVNLNAYPSGTYIVTMKSSKGKVVTTTLVK